MNMLASKQYSCAIHIPTKARTPVFICTIHQMTVEYPTIK
jgi:hypothetical protein